MIHHFDLPVRPKPVAPPFQDGTCLPNRADADASLAPLSVRRSRIFSQALSTFQRMERESSSRRGFSAGENLKPGSFPVVDGKPVGIKAAAESCIRRKPLPCETKVVSIGFASPASSAEYPFAVSCLEEEGFAGGLAAVSALDDSPPPYPLSESDAWLEEASGSFQQNLSSTSSSAAARNARTRSTSSSYPTDGEDLARIQSPASPPYLSYRLSTSDLARYSHGNERLSYLRSSTTSPRSYCGNGEPSYHDAMLDTAAVTTEWEEERPEGSGSDDDDDGLTTISELRPSDSMSQCGRSRSTVYQLASSPAKEYHGRASCSTGRSAHSFRPFKQQYDGAIEHQRLDSPDFSAPPQFDAGEGHFKRSKRKSSQFSLRSITSPFAKRPRLGLKKLAHNVYRESQRRFSQVRQLWKHHSQLERKEFDAWRAVKKRERPADALKGKLDKTYSQFTFERSRFGDAEWWGDGVKRYQAPEWMVFGKRDQ